MILAIIWAQTTPVDPFIPSLVQQGVLAFVVIALIFGWLLTRPSVEQERKLHAESITRLQQDKEEAQIRAMRAEEQRDNLLKQVTQSLPVMQEATQASKRMIPVLEDLIERLNDQESRYRRRPRD